MIIFTEDLSKTLRPLTGIGRQIATNNLSMTKFYNLEFLRMNRKQYLTAGPNFKSSYLLIDTVDKQRKTSTNKKIPSLRGRV